MGCGGTWLSSHLLIFKITIMQNFAETDINRFIEAQEVPYFCGYKQALERGSLHKDKIALSIFGDIDTIKVRSCMTMLDFLSPNDIFGEVLDSFYKSERCKLTLKVMQHG